MPAPFISVIVPSFNQGRFIERTLLSVLRQKYSGRFELIVSDGGSTDETVDILKKYSDRITWWSKKDKGFADAVNKGVKAAKGEVLGIQSSDDFYLENTFENIMSGFNAHGDAGFISGRDLGIDLEGRVLWARRQSGKLTPKSVLLGPESICQHASFIKRSLYERIGGLKTDIDMCADMDLWYRASHFQPGYFISSQAGVYQVQPAQRTQTSKKFYENLVRMVESCEASPEYAAVSRLSPEEKRSLFLFWEIVYTLNYDKATGISIARKNIGNMAGLDKRTSALIAKYAKNPVDHTLHLLRSGGFISAVADKLYAKTSKANLDWWK